MKYWGSKVFLILLAGLLNLSQLAAQEPLILEKIELHIEPGAAELHLDNSWQKFRARRITPKLRETIKADLLEQFRIRGYYLARLDSMHIQAADENNGIMHLFFSAGFRFVFGSVKMEFADSLNGIDTAAVRETAADFQRRPFNESAERQLFKSILNIFENAGYPMCRIRTAGFEIDSVSRSERNLSLLLKIDAGPEIHLASLQVPANTLVNAQFLERVLRFHPGEKYRQARIEKYRRILGRQDFVKSTEPLQVIQDADSSYRLLLNFLPAKSTAFDGIVGYVPPATDNPAEKGYFTGLVNLGLRNIFGTGRRMDVYWEKPDKFSEEFRVNYREPFLIGLPFHAALGLHRLVRDTTYIQWQYSLQADLPLNENLTGTLRFYNRQVFPDSLASRTARLPRTKAIHSEMGISLDTRNHRLNPTGGVLFKMLFDYGTQRNVGPAYLIAEDSLQNKIRITRLTARLQFLLRTLKKQVLSLDFHSVLIGSKGEPVRTPDMFWFGGAATIRGYREQQFFAERVGWLNTEYRFLLAPQSTFFVFSDVGYFYRASPERTEQNLVGYGLGLRFPGPLGLVQVDYGLARGTSFREGKIHFRIINNF